MTRERRKGSPRIPENIRSILSLKQRLAIRELQTFGWVIDFVRRPLFQDPKVIMRDPKSGKLAMVLGDGTVDYNSPELTTRSSD